MKKPVTIPAKLKCEQLWADVSEYIDGKLPTTRRRAVEAHAKTCARCKSVLEGTRNIVELVSSEKSFELPDAVSRRLYSKLDDYLDHQDRPGSQTIPVGITKDEVALGSHLIYFWESDSDFERGVNFLYPGLGKGDHCIAFGHQEALDKVMSVLRADGYDPDRLIADRQLTVLLRQSSADATVSDIGAVMDAALRAGANAIRFLGNLGMGRAPLPAGEDDVLKLETKVTSMLAQVPSVVVCMYDIKTVSGRLILKGGLETHHLTVCHEGVRENPYFAPQHPAKTQHIH